MRFFFAEACRKEHTFMFAPAGWTVGDLEATGFQGPTRLIIEALEHSEVQVVPLGELSHATGDVEANFQRMLRRAGALQRRVLMMMARAPWSGMSSFWPPTPSWRGG